MMHVGRGVQRRLKAFNSSWKDFEHLMTWNIWSGVFEGILNPIWVREQLPAIRAEFQRLTGDQEAYLEDGP